MKTTVPVLAVLAALSSQGSATALQAQQTARPAASAQPAAAQPPLPIPSGAQIQGLCIFSWDSLFEHSRVGQFVVTRVNQISAQTNAELTEQRRSLEAAASNLRAQVQAQGEQALAAQIDAHNQRAQQHANLIQLREAEIEQTQFLARARFAEEARPLVIQVSQAERCSIVLDGDSAIYPDPRADITPKVVTALDAKIQQFTIEKAVAPTQPAAAAAPTPAGATR